MVPLGATLVRREDAGRWALPSFPRQSRIYENLSSFSGHLRASLCLFWWKLDLLNGASSAIAAADLDIDRKSVV